MFKNSNKPWRDSAVGTLEITGKKKSWNQNM